MFVWHAQFLFWDTLYQVSSFLLLKFQGCDCKFNCKKCHQTLLLPKVDGKVQISNAQRHLLKFCKADKKEGSQRSILDSISKERSFTITEGEEFEWYVLSFDHI